MRTNRLFPNRLGMIAAMIIAAFAASSQAWTQDSTVSPYHLLKKVVLGGEGGWDYFTVDPVTHHIFIGRGDYVMVLDSDGNVVGKLDVGKAKSCEKDDSARVTGR